MNTGPARDVQNLWQKLEALFAREVEPPRLRPPAAVAEVVDCERQLGMQLPAALRESYRRHDGGELGDGFEWLSLAEVERSWRYDCEFAEDSVADEFTDDGLLVDTPFHARRIPIVKWVGDDVTIYVDNLPGPSGTTGQIIINHNECEFLVLADGVADFLSYLCDLLRARKELHDPDYGFFAEHRDGLRRRLAAVALPLSDPDRLELQRLVLRGDQEAVRDWIRAAKPLDEQDRAGHTALWHAVERGERRIARQLLAAGADASLAGGWSPLMNAAYQGDLETLRDLLEAGADVAWRDDFGQTALHVAAGAGRLEVAHALLRAGAEVNAADSQWRHTALTRAARGGHAAVVALLLEHGADATAP